jgi:hypothetical protein
VKRHGDNPNLPAAATRPRGIFDSQSWKWLTERLAYLPQVRLVFGEELLQFAGANENFVEP